MRVRCRCPAGDDANRKAKEQVDANARVKFHAHRMTPSAFSEFKAECVRLTGRELPGYPSGTSVGLAETNRVASGSDWRDTKLRLCT